MKRFYTPEHGIIIGDEAHHAIHVLRCKPGESVETINGKGQLYSAIIESIGKDRVLLCELSLEQEEFDDPNKLSVAIAPPKNPARFEWFLEKAVEIGIAEIFPVITRRSERTSLKMDRLQNIILSAVKQSKQLFLPTLHPIQPIEIILAHQHISTSAHRFIAHCGSARPPFLGNVYIKGHTALILIGPEGDFSPEEVDAALNNNYQAVSLGNSILRVETAGVVACTIVNSINHEK